MIQHPMSNEYAIMTRSVCVKYPELRDQQVLNGKYVVSCSNTGAYGGSTMGYRALRFKMFRYSNRAVILKLSVA